MKRILAWVLALSLLLLAGCGTVVPLRKAETPPQTEQTAPAEPEAGTLPPEDAPAAEEPAEEPPLEPEAETPPPVPAEEPVEVMPIPEEPEPEAPEASAPAEAEPEEEEPTPPEEADPEEPAPAEGAAPEPQPETADSLRAVVTVSTERQEHRSEDGDALLMREVVELPQLRLLNGPLRIEAQINSSLKEDLEVLRQSLADENGRDRLLVMAEEQYAYYAEEGWAAAFPGYSETRSVEVPRCDSRVLSFLYTDSFYAGGAHGTAMQHGISYSLETGKLLSFDDLSDAPEALRQRCVEFIDGTIQKDYAAGEIVPDYKDLLPGLTADPNWCLSEEGLVIVVQEYVLGSFALGMPRFTVPYAVLAGLLRPELLPAPRQEDDGWIGVSREAGDADFTARCGSGGEALTLAAGGTVYDLALTTIRFERDFDGNFHPVTDRLVWRCGRLEDGELLRLEGLSGGSAPTLRLRFRTADGTEHTNLLGFDAEGSLMTFPES